MSTTLYDISSLPNTFSIISPSIKRKETDSIALLENERNQECLKQDDLQGHDEDLAVKMNKCDKIEENIPSPTEKNLLPSKNDSAKDKKMFRRIVGVSDEVGDRTGDFRKLFYICLNRQ